MNRVDERKYKLEAFYAENKLPNEFLDLVNFLSSLPGNAILLEYEISKGFILLAGKNKASVYAYSKNKSFSSSIIPFVQADGTGSFYAFWQPS